MRLHQIFALALLTGCLQMAAASQPSHEFKEEIERALKAPTAEERVELLTQAVESASINDVALGMPGYFPHDIFRTARSEGVCSAETDTLLHKMQTATQVGFEEYMKSNHEEYRDVLSEAIRCIHFAYREGIPGGS